MAIPTPRPADRAREPDRDAPPGPLRLSVAHYYKMAEGGILEGDGRYELIHGVIYPMPPIGPKHAYTVERLRDALRSCAGDRATVVAQYPLRIGDDSEPHQSDVLVLKPPLERYSEHHPTPEDVLLVVEVAHTTLESDRTLKHGLYARGGILEYWILDLAKTRLEVYRKPDVDEGQYLELTTLVEGENITPVELERCRVTWWE